MIMIPTIPKLLSSHIYKDLYVNLPEKPFMFHIYQDVMLVINLKNALKRGKYCDYYYVSFTDSTKNFYDSFYKWLDDWSFLEFIDVLFKNDNTFKNISIRHREVKGIWTFSPFVKIKPIKKPEKWTVTHVWKAILSGQIQEVYKRQHLTDDYKLDYDSNFYAGYVNPLEFARELIDDNNCWWIRLIDDSGNTLKIGVNKENYDYNELIFVEKMEEY